jgi:hypothetical protein
VRLWRLEWIHLDIVCIVWIVREKWILIAVFGSQGLGGTFILQRPGWWWSFLLRQPSEFDLSVGNLPIELVESGIPFWY